MFLAGLLTRNLQADPAHTFWPLTFWELLCKAHPRPAHVVHLAQQPQGRKAHSPNTSVHVHLVPNEHQQECLAFKYGGSFCTCAPAGIATFLLPCAATYIQQQSCGPPPIHPRRLKVQRALASPSQRESNASFTADFSLYVQ